MKTLPLRIFSALIAIALLIGSYIFWGLDGVVMFAFLGCLVGTYEYSKLALSSALLPKFFKVWFMFIGLILMAATVHLGGELLLGVWGVGLTLFIAGSLWVLRRLPENAALLQAVGAGALGLIYCGLFPMQALRLVMLPNGDKWFLFLFFVAFAGDTFAYFGGIFFGKKKFMPNISPNKTVAGSVSGILGSMVLGYFVARWGLPQLSLGNTLLLAGLGSWLAQNGDLFESLLKRVAGVKDSGRIMPGHGGILDRLDGIYFAAPVVYLTALWHS